MFLQLYSATDNTTYAHAHLPITIHMLVLSLDMLGDVVLGPC